MAGSPGQLALLESLPFATVLPQVPTCYGGLLSGCITFSNLKPICLKGTGGVDGSGP